VTEQCRHAGGSAALPQYDRPTYRQLRSC